MNYINNAGKTVLKYDKCGFMAFGQDALCAFAAKRIMSESGDPPRSRRQNERYIKKDLGNKDRSCSSDR